MQIMAIDKLGQGPIIWGGGTPLYWLYRYAPFHLYQQDHKQKPVKNYM